MSTPRSRKMVIGFWIATALFCLQIGFTAYAQLRLPQVAEAFTHLGFPDYFRVELSWAKFLGIVLLVAPPPSPRPRGGLVSLLAPAAGGRGWPDRDRYPRLTLNAFSKKVRSLIEAKVSSVPRSR
jgi:hypothetical protein